MRNKEKFLEMRQEQLEWDNQCDFDRQPTVAYDASVQNTITFNNKNNKQINYEKEKTHDTVSFYNTKGTIK